MVTYNKSYKLCLKLLYFLSFLGSCLTLSTIRTGRIVPRAKGLGLGLIEIGGKEKCGALEAWLPAARWPSSKRERQRLGLEGKRGKALGVQFCQS